MVQPMPAYRKPQTWLELENGDGVGEDTTSAQQQEKSKTTPQKTQHYPTNPQYSSYALCTIILNNFKSNCLLDMVAYAGLH